MRRLLAAALVSCALPGQNVAAPPRFAAARDAIAAEIERGATPSLAIAVLDGGKAVWAEGFGLANVEAGTPATADTIYRLASISKPFTATAIMQLVERGLVDLDAPVNRYLDAKLRAYRGTADAITVRRLLNHTAGLPTHWNFFYGDERPPTRAESIRRFGFAAYEPGSRTNYSNFAFGVLDHLIAIVGKKGYRGWLVEELLDPLGMTHTDVGVRPGQEPHAAVGYRRDGGAWVAVTDYGFDHDGASAIRSSANDLMRFARLQLERGTVDNVRVLDVPSALAMREKTGERAGSSFGIGWSVGTLRGVPVLRHSGGMPGVSTQLCVFPDRNAAIAVLTNAADRGATNRALEKALDALIGEAAPEPQQFGGRPGPSEVERTAYRGLLVHPDGAMPCRFAVGVTLGPFGGPNLALGDGEAAGCKAVLHGSRLEISCTRQFSIGHPGVGPVDLTFELDRDGDVLHGVCYATLDGVCRLPYWVELYREHDKPADTLRAITYNVLVGFEDSEVGRFLPGCQREVRIAAWLAAQRPDVVALQEMNGFDEQRLQRLAAIWGHQHVALLKPDGYPVALTANAPLDGIARDREGMHHGMLRATTHGIDFVAVHFRPQSDVEFKLGECELALARYREALAAGREAVVLGDFNSIATGDVQRFAPTARERYAKWQWRLDGDAPTEIAMTPLLEYPDGGAVDVVAARPDGVPEQLPLPRIDFVLASPALAERCTYARWYCDDALLELSDHPPVLADFAAPAAPANRK